jgi:hypothetical protein
MNSVDPAPATKDSLALPIEFQGDERLFSASANKAFILCKRLR